MKATWKGSIRFGMILIAAKLYTAIEKGEEIKFNLAHKGDCLGEVGMPKACKKCNAALDKDTIAKVYREGDKVVVIEDTDLESIKLDTDKVIDIIGFVKSEEIPTTFFDSPYFLGPDGNTASRPYILLREVMKKTKKVALAKVVLRGGEDFVVIRPMGNGLLLQKLYYPREVRAMETVPGIPQTSTKVDNSELSLASTLVANMETTFDQVELTDRHFDAMKAMLAAKLKGDTYKSETTQAPPPPVDIMEALRASLEAQQKKQKQAKGTKAA